MKKRAAVILMTMVILSTLVYGCGATGKTGSQSGAAGEGVVTESETGEEDDGTSAEVKTFAGILEEKRDMLFIITSDSGEAYAIGFEEAPEGYDDLSVGDEVVMEYKGELSEIDSFTGEIVSLKPAK